MTIMKIKEYEEAFRDLPDAMTPKEAADALRVSTKTIYKLLRTNTLPAIRVGREYRIAKSTLIGYLLGRYKSRSNPDCVVSVNSCGKVWTKPTYYSIVPFAYKNNKQKGDADNGKATKPCRKRSG